MNADGRTAGTRVALHRFATGPGVDQGGPRLERIIIRGEGAALSSFRVELPTGARCLFIETTPFAAGECFVSPARPRGSNGVAKPGDVHDGIDVAKFSTLGIEGCDQLFVDTTVAFLENDEPLVLVAVVGEGLWVHPRVAIELTGDITIPIADPLPVDDPVSQGILNQLVALLTLQGQAPTTATHSQDDATYVSSTVLAANANRLGGTILNFGPDTVYLHFGAAAALVASDFPLVSGASYSLRQANLTYEGEVRAICDTGDTADLRFVELT